MPIADNAVSTNQMRNEFSEMLNSVAYGRQRIALARRRKVMAIFIPAEKDLVDSLTSTVTSTEARDNLSEVLNRVHFGKEVIGIMRHNSVLAVVISADTHEKLVVRDYRPLLFLAPQH